MKLTQGELFSILKSVQETSTVNIQGITIEKELSYSESLFKPHAGKYY